MKKFILDKKKIPLILMLVFNLLAYLLWQSNEFVGIILAVMLTILCVINLYRSRNNILLFMLNFQFFYYNYSVVFSRYLHTVNEFKEFYINADVSTMNIGIICLCVFEIFFTMFFDPTQKYDQNKIYAKKSNNMISLALLIIAAIASVLSFDWSGFGARGANSSIYEYVGILLILGLHYSGVNKTNIIKYGYSILIIFLVLSGLVFGERVSALQFMFIWALYFLGDKISPKKIFIFSILGLILMTMVGSYRNSYNLDKFNFGFVINTLGDRMLTFDGADLGYYCSLTFIMVANLVSNTTRFNMFGKFLESIVFGESVDNKLSIFTHEFYFHQYGGHFPLYFYFYGGIIMVFVVCWLWNKFLCSRFKSNVKSKSSFSYILGVYLVCICARWYMYTPLNAIRSPLLFAIAYLLLAFVNKLRKTRSDNHG